MVWPPDVDISPSSSGNYSAVVPKVADGHNSKINRGFATQGTQTSPKLADQANQTAANQAGANQQVPQQAKKPRRPLEKQYSLAARDRRLRQEYTNYHHPPKEEDVWICEFCEYESIFGVAPKALIRQYEAKDRRERKRLAEKRRLLEKAKMKGRKGKKGNKKNGNAVTQAQHPAHTQRYDQPPMNEVPVQHHRMQSDDYGVDDDDADDDDPIPPPRTPSKIPQPVAQNYNQSLRPPSGSAIAKNADRKASD